STINYQLSTINHQPSTINHPAYVQDYHPSFFYRRTTAWHSAWQATFNHLVTEQACLFPIINHQLFALSEA
ncbi:MAG: hypothetical protein J7L40_00435, partial [Candidatus Marinimicrobia bacterium]|nr:hypothetical protein [Candidatus Neomarinimicrobiota bacterium]